jgi:hypothetical protein
VLTFGPFWGLSLAEWRKTNMGVIDKIFVKLTCDNCKIEEINTALDTGSGWGGSHWDELSNFSEFDAVITGGGREDPRVKTAACKKCGQAARIEVNYQT